MMVSVRAKKYWMLLFVLTFFTVVSSRAMAYFGQPVSIIIDGQTVALNQPAMIVNDRVMVPLRGIFENLGASVNYDPSTRSITCLRGSQRIELFMDSRQAYLNGVGSTLDSAPVDIGGRILVPLRFVSESLGAEVHWTAYNQTVDILSRTGGANLPLPTAYGPSQIYSVTQNAHHVLSAGETLAVELRGEPGGTAMFDISGLSNEIPMQEVSPGVYQGTYLVNPGTFISNARIIGHLELRGQESAASFSSVVSMDARIRPVARTIVSPLAGAAVSTSRPNLSAYFPVTVDPSSTRFYLDGMDLSAQAQMNSNSMLWIPGFDLTPGEHHVLVTAVGIYGETLRREWNFYVSPNAVSTGMLPGPSY